MSIPQEPPAPPLCPKGCPADPENPVEREAGSWFCPQCRSFYSGSAHEWEVFAGHRERAVLSSNPTNEGATKP